jgi:hypothetical protein
MQLNMNHDYYCSKPSLISLQLIRMSDIFLFSTALLMSLNFPFIFCLKFFFFLSFRATFGFTNPYYGLVWTNSPPTPPISPDYQGYWKNRPSQQLFKLFISYFIYFRPYMFRPLLAIFRRNTQSF